MHTDLVISPFDADVRAMVEVAWLAERGGFDGVWTFDHFSGAMLGRRWSRDPFVVLGAIAASTERVRLGVLVANVVNRHPAQLASALDSLASLAPGRVSCGLGSGAAPGTRFAGEHDAIGRGLGDAPARRRHLVETIEALKVIWAGKDRLVGDHVVLDGLAGVVEPGPRPPIIVGASGARTVRLAAEHADGVNIRRGPALPDRVALVRSLTGDRPFEISVFDDLDPAHPLGGDVDTLAALGVHRRTLVVAPPYPVAAIARIGARLAVT